MVKLRILVIAQAETITLNYTLLQLTGGNSELKIRLREDDPLRKSIQETENQREAIARKTFVQIRRLFLGCISLAIFFFSCQIFLFVVI
jgi:hypothetical protein